MVAPTTHDGHAAHDEVEDATHPAPAAETKPHATTAPHKAVSHGEEHTPAVSPHGAEQAAAHQGKHATEHHESAAEHGREHDAHHDAEHDTAPHNAAAHAAHATKSSHNDSEEHAAKPPGRFASATSLWPMLLINLLVMMTGAVGAIVFLRLDQRRGQRNRQQATS